MGIFSQVAIGKSRLAAKRSVEADQHDSEDEDPGEDLQSVLSDKVSSEVSMHSTFASNHI